MNRCVVIDYQGQFVNLAGNVLGSDTLRKVTGQQAVMTVAPARRYYDTVAYAYSFGYSGDGDAGTAPSDRDLPFTTSFIHGDYNSIGNASIWRENVPRALPPSLYLSGKPAWFGAVPWPPIGPDVLGGPGPSGHAFDIPAKVCHAGLPRDASGNLVFDANTCYPRKRPEPPANLGASVR